MKMTPGHTRSRTRQAAWVRVPLVLVAAATAAATAAGLAGCSSGKPAYCTDRTNLQSSVKGLTSAGISGIKTQLKQIESDASTLVSSAKSDFPSETSAITSSVNTLKSSVTALPSSPSAVQIATVGKDAAGVVSSVKSFVDASNSKCS
jgi:hypothetical protein